jgi:hypothetical protein
MALQGCILLQGLLVESTCVVGEVMHPLPIETTLDGGDHQQRSCQTEETEELAPVEIVDLRVP